ncbi:hypothetical protein QW71_36570, partial [Paenibacillus sp. IHB B 3415]|uniref:hypothetical protein n=1 Tax=Paenibacillus sp. IHB B 3415 TaxID=867080 RepID=UPI000574A50E
FWKLYPYHNMGNQQACMKYNNLPAKRLRGGGMLYFIQQFWIRAEIMRKMLYFVQDFFNTPDFHHD